MTQKDLLRLDKVVKNFGGLRAVDEVSLSIHEGHFAGLIGPNGSGKTTLFNVISGFNKPDRGEIYFGDKKIDGFSQDQIYKMGLIRTFQNPRLFLGMATLENLLVPPVNQVGEKVRYAPLRQRWRPQEISLAEEGVNLAETLELGGVVSNLASDVSGGQMKLLELGRSMMGKPKLLLLDEPTAGISPKLAREIFERILRLRETHGVTFFIIEHRLEMLFDYVEHVFVMHQGKIIAQGTKDEVVNDPTVKKVYLGS